MRNFWQFLVERDAPGPQINPVTIYGSGTVSGDEGTHLLISLHGSDTLCLFGPIAGGLSNRKINDLLLLSVGDQSYFHFTYVHFSTNPSILVGRSLSG